MKRKDLQGVRGVAILAVLGFHFFPKIFPNGYIGVDIFFVLSGFLMTLIFGSKSMSLDSVYQFYYKRAKRILPLYLLMILTGCVLVFFLFPSPFVPMNMDSAWDAILLFKNMARNSDSNAYFQMLNQGEDLFTHTWSLCVEMQFYLLAPLIFFLFPICTSPLLLSLYLISLISSSLVLYFLSSENVSFNNVLCRVWQFIAGSAVFFIARSWTEHNGKVSEKDAEEQKSCEPSRAACVSWLLLPMTLLSLFLATFSPLKIAPSVLRMTSTFLTASAILLGTVATRNPMKNKFLVYLGDISYSLYLVHWPIYVYVKHAYENQTFAYLVGVAVAVVIAVGITETFEKWYLQLGKVATFSMIFTFYVLICAVVLNKGNVSKLLDRIRYGDESFALKFPDFFDNTTFSEAVDLNRKWARAEYKYMTVANCFPNDQVYGFCEFANVSGREEVVFLVGNSMVPNLGALVFSTFGKRAKSMSMYSYPYCETLTLADENRCKEQKEKYFSEVERLTPDVVFLLDRPDKLTRPLQKPVDEDEIFLEALETLQKYESVVKRKIFMLGSYTPPRNINLSQFVRLLETDPNVTQSVYHTDFSYLNAVQRQLELVKRCRKCHLIPIYEVLYNGNQTKNFDDKTKLAYYFDGLHITPFGLNLILPLFRNLQ